MIFDIIAGTGDTTGGIGSWTPAELFKNGEEGAWYDASDWSLMFQDGPATQPVTAVGQTLGAWFNKIPGQPTQYHIGQGSVLLRPTIVSNNGKLAVRFDGVDDQVGGNTLSVNYTGLTMAVGQKKSSYEYSEVLNLQSGLGVVQNMENGKPYTYILDRTAQTTVQESLSSANVIIVYGSPTVPATIRLNGSVVTGTVTSAPLWSCKVLLPGQVNNDCDISQVVFINRAITTAEAVLLESYIASKQ